MVCITTNDSENAQFKAGDWGRRDRYADEAQLAAAQKELEDMTQQLDDWDNDGLLSPAERKILESEYDSIVAEYDSIIDQAKDVSLNSSDTAVTTTEHYTAYTTYTGTTDEDGGEDNTNGSQPEGFKNNLWGRLNGIFNGPLPYRFARLFVQNNANERMTDLMK
jgi:hypothetical protein